MERKVTIQDIADMVNVSKSSVSRYLNNGYISSKNAEKIRKAIEETGFQSNFFAKRLKTKRSHLIGIVLPRMNSVTVGNLLTGINRLLEAHEYQGMILLSGLKLNKEISNIKSFFQQGVDGIIVNSIGITDEHIELMKSINLPVVFTGQKHEAVNYIKIDDYRAGVLMGNYIKGKGHKRVVYLGVSESDQAVGVERRQGFVDAFCDGNPGADIHFIETDFNFDSAFDRGAEIINYQPTAVVGATDNIALGVINYLHEQRVSIPHEVSVAGFGGYDVGKLIYPPLTSIKFDFEKIGERVAQGVLDLINGGDLKLNQTILPELLERKSVAERQK